MNTTEPRDLVGQTVRAIEALENALKSQIEMVFDGIEGDVLDKLCTNVYYIKDWYELPEEIVWNWEDYA